MSAARSLGGGVGRRPQDGVLLRALHGELPGGTPALRRRLFAVICVVVVCELLVILAVGTHHAGDARPSARSGELPAQTPVAAPAVGADRPRP